MDEATKRVFDAVLAVLAMGGGVVAFVKALHEWRESQRWKRSEQLDKLVEKFESTPLLRLACTIVDWTTREVKYDGKEVVITNRDVLLALRDHTEGSGVRSFEGQQPLIRDAYDCLLTFLARLEVAIETRLVDEEPAKTYFAYWLKRFVTMDKHPRDFRDSDAEVLSEGLGERTPEEMAAVYVNAYADLAVIRSLCARFGVPPPSVPARAAS
ncbi:MAG: hypothetical protein JST00_45850 [Deltaproteobacteria bacterium]|nr:hypothetical protein [Deltaproteobacteria bacterium]